MEVGSCCCRFVAMFVAAVNPMGAATVDIVGVIPNNSSADEFDAIYGFFIEFDGSCELTCMTVCLTPWRYCTCFRYSLRCEA